MSLPRRLFARESGNALCVLPHGGAHAAILYRAGGEDLQQVKAAKEVKTLVAVKLKLKIHGRQPTTMDEAWGSGGVKPEGNTVVFAPQDCV